jgi:hypothetical protein
MITGRLRTAAWRQRSGNGTGRAWPVADRDRWTCLEREAAKNKIDPGVRRDHEQRLRNRPIER